MSVSAALWMLAQLVVVVSATAAAVAVGRSRGVAARKCPQPTAEETTLLLERCGRVGKILRTHYDQLARLLKSSIFSPRSNRSRAEEDLDEYRALNLSTSLRIERYVDDLNQLLNRCGPAYRRQRQQLQTYAGKSVQLDQAFEQLVNNPRSSRVELKQLVREICDENHRLRTDLSKCRERLTDLLAESPGAEREPRVDPLTQLITRDGWEERIEQLDLATRPSVGMLDVDRFRSINERYGRDAGDAVLSMVGTVLRSTDGVVAFRVTGDRFAILIQRANEHAAKRIAEQLRTRIEAARARVDQQDISATASVGLLHCSADTSLAALSELVERALDQAKSRGGNQIHVYSD